MLSVYYIYDLPFWRDPTSLMKNLLGGWQISGSSFFRTGTPFSITRTNDIAGVGDGGNRPAGRISSAIRRQRERQVLGRRRRPTTTSSSTRRRSPTRRQGTFGNSTRDILRNPGDQQWDLAIFKNFSLHGQQRLQFRVEMFNFINHPNLSGPNADITNAELRPLDQQGRQPARHSARAAVHLLARIACLTADGADHAEWTDADTRISRTGGG